MGSVTKAFVRAARVILAIPEPYPDFFDSQNQLILLDDILSIREMFDEEESLAIVRGFMTSPKGIHVIIEKENGARTNLLQSIAKASEDRIISLTACEREGIMPTNSKHFPHLAA